MTVHVMFSLFMNGHGLFTACSVFLLVLMVDQSLYVCQNVNLYIFFLCSIFPIPLIYICIWYCWCCCS